MCHVLCMENVQSWVDFLIVLFMDCVQSFVKVLFVESVQSWSRHQNCKRRRELLLSVWVYILIPNWCRETILVTAPKLQEDWIGTQGISISLCLLSLWVYLSLAPQDVTAPRIARGVPLPVYINLDLYSGFWCTSRCVVFKYSVPPLTDQVLRKVLLTSWKKLTIVVWWVSGLLNVLFSWYTVMIQVQ